jgi:hypothetical protein
MVGVGVSVGGFGVGVADGGTVVGVLVSGTSVSVAVASGVSVIVGVVVLVGVDVAVSVGTSVCVDVGVLVAGNGIDWSIAIRCASHEGDWNASTSWGWAGSLNSTITSPPSMVTA